MGVSVAAKCLDCGEVFTVAHGGGFSFHLLRCDRCGKMKSVGFDELGETHLRYLKWAPGPYCIASMEHDRWVHENAQVEPLSPEEYEKNVEAFASSCDCGGNYSLNAQPRCPKCLSTKIEEGEVEVLYD